MKRGRRTPQRYQLDRRTVALVAKGHPWIFRGNLSTAASALADGQWVALHDGHNQVVGHGVYAAEGAIALRLLARGPARPRAALFAARIEAALARRAALRHACDGFRAVHGESDELPGVTVDVYGGVVVAQAYASGVDGLAGFAARHVAAAVGASAIVLRAGHRRVGGTAAPPRILRGAPPAEVAFHEGALTLYARPLAGQKGGTFLDLRHLRRWLTTAPLAGARVLNLFAYSGTLGLAAEHAGAAHITHVDRAADALELARRHVLDPARHAYVTADVFDWLPAATARHDLVIVDPPSMTSRIEQVPSVLATYQRLHRAAAARVAPGGILVLCCCTSRVTRAQFRATVARLGLPVIADLAPEPDHPVGFPEADYLKVLIVRAP